ncbi:MAG: exodeoxyribonuclease VII small subunit [Candidatus Bipolaricaulota bacterium]|nr:exodeoxyribonuclease VII small subunit [Candidatus Bipolaricaulota bacterium]MCX7843757.1 exodeoxyribonuclease VII small subunit [Candidatus Bipolaricaulota bacterium]MDW8151339.1 exodeoxyribonuclease VII small subunit [Candidatus Bipolaricaulota bacterium]
MEPRTEPTYTEAVARLDAILERIERGEVDIDELSQLVAEAAELVALLRRKITAAEMQIRTITERLERPEEGPPEEEVPF